MTNKEVQARLAMIQAGEATAQARALLVEARRLREEAEKLMRFSDERFAEARKIIEEMKEELA